MPDFDISTNASAAAGGRELDADTHGQCVSGAGTTTATETTVGTITLPAGGPWNIFGIYGQVVRATATAAQALACHVRMNASQGDLDPNPSPTRFPIPPGAASLGATINSDGCPLQIWPTRYVAPGKASIDMILSQDVIATVAPQCVLGLIYGKTIPERRPFIFMDRVRTTVSSAADTAIGTITLAEKATRITWIGGVLVQDGVVVTAEELIGFFRLQSDDVKMDPAQFPFSCVHSAGLGALIQGTPPRELVMIPVSIPVQGGARVNAYSDLNIAVTNGADIAIYIAYE